VGSSVGGHQGGLAGGVGVAFEPLLDELVPIAHALDVQTQQLAPGDLTRILVSHPTVMRAPTQQRARAYRCQFVVPDLSV
jgi:hypothetical protein